MIWHRKGCDSPAFYYRTLGTAIDVMTGGAVPDACRDESHIRASDD
jgi:hypothetical protein